MKKVKTEFTPTEFAAKIGVHQTTISRWMAHDFSKRKFRAYDAEVVEVAGKKFIKVTK